jgi:hypothetical protein
MPKDADPRLDISSELYGWPTALDAVREQMKAAATPFDPEGREVVVVGPHWTVCAQLHAGLPGVRVGCATPARDDFDGWLPRSEWRKAEHVLFVTDNRFDGDGGDQLPLHVPAGRSRVKILRSGRVARTFALHLYERRASGRLGDDLPPEVRQALHEAHEEREAKDDVRDAHGVLNAPDVVRGRLDDEAVAEEGEHPERPQQPPDAAVQRHARGGACEHRDERDRRDEGEAHLEVPHGADDDQADELDSGRGRRDAGPREGPGSLRDHGGRGRSSRVPRVSADRPSVALVGARRSDPPHPR